MTVTISERSFETHIEAVLLGETTPDGALREPGPTYDLGRLSGRYHRRPHTDYDRALCLLPNDVHDFIIATQPQAWERLQQHHKEDTRALFMTKLSREIDRHGTLHVLRHGIKERGVKFDLAYFRPGSGRNEALTRLHHANLFAVVRQLHYSQQNENSLDLALFLNGIPLFTAELKNPLNGQTVEHAIRQYRSPARDPREPLLAYGRCLAHFAVDPELVYVTTRLDGQKTRFLPFNLGRNGGAGNPPAPPTQNAYATDYLWRDVLAPPSVLDLVNRFIHEVEEEDEDGRKSGKRYIIFPRHHQLECVRQLVADSRDQGAGRRYLIQHSAGSGKSYTIAWLAHQLSTLHDAADRRVFDSIIVITDRRILDRQLQQTIRQFEQTLGVVENIDTTSRQLRQALEDGKTIIVTTLQKFPVIAGQISELPGKRFAVIIDEAHSSQTGESSKSMKSVLRARTLEEAEAEEAAARTAEEELDDAVLAEVEKRGRQPNLSLFAFTATPKAKTLELFGRRQPDGTFRPFHLYSMRQAIEEGFILDVLENYTTYRAYWQLLKKVEDDPRYDKSKASYLLKSFVELSPQAIDAKVRIMIDHFEEQARHQIGGKAKAMIVTRSRLHAVRYKLAVDRYLAEKSRPYKALVAFSGTVDDGPKSYTEQGMNGGIPEAQTAKTFERPDYRLLIAANKFQTGFDQPLLHTMYVDKKLGGVGAVQTLSRLNRTHPEKTGTAVLDFANDADDIKAAFDPYYETTLLSEATDPDLLYDLDYRLLAYGVYTKSDIDAFAHAYFLGKKRDQPRLYAVLDPVISRVGGLHLDEQRALRGQLTDYIRLYAFLSQVLPFQDADLEKLYAFARYLRTGVNPGEEELPREVQQNIDLDSYTVRETGKGRIKPTRGQGTLDPQGTQSLDGTSPELIEPLSQIIADLNARFGDNAATTAAVAQVMEKLNADAGLAAGARVNTRENLLLSFRHKAVDGFQDLVDSNFNLYKRITEDEAFGEYLINLLFEQYLRVNRHAAELIHQGESKTLEFKSSLRWDVKLGQMNDKAITHAVLKTIAAFLNTDGGDLVIGVADDGRVLGVAHDDLDDDDKFMRHLMQVVVNGLGDRASTLLDPKMEMIEGKTVCLVGCRRSPEPVFLKWKGMEKTPDGDFYVRSGPGSRLLKPADTKAYIATRFPT